MAEPDSVPEDEALFLEERRCEYVLVHSIPTPGEILVQFFRADAA
jgi:hypothetical protein